MNKFVDIIKREQNADGSFPSWSAPLAKWREGKITATSFFTSLILKATPRHTLQNNKTTMTMFSKACHFLLLQKSSNWTWNYWRKKSLESSQFPIPDDLDDTFCAAQAFYLNSPKKIPAPGLAKLIKLLTTQEANIGGPYKTWVVPASFSNKWQDIDLAVNSNIAYFLSFYDIKSKNITEFIDKTIAKKSYTSPYYATPYPVLYFLSRTYQGSHKKQIINFIKSKQKLGAWGNPQDTALAIISLLNLEIATNEVQKAISYLTTLPTKEILPYPFCTDPQQNGQKYAAGSRALTAALIFEALTKYEQKQRQEKNRCTGKSAEEKFYFSITKQIYLDVQTINLPLQKEILNWIDKVLATDKDHKIILVSYWVSGHIPKITRPASLATFYGWMTYLLQDKMLDGDAGPELIPATNYFQGRLDSIIIKLEKSGVKASQLLNKLSQTMDEANYFELHNLRLGKSTSITLPKIPTRYSGHKLLADKSIGFSFGPTLVSKNTKQFFHHYLIARQLNDDAHDWEQDLEQGRLNSVSIMLIAKWQKLHPNQLLNRNNAVAKLRPLFWNSTIDTVGKQIKAHCLKADKESPSFPLLIQPLQTAANKALAQKQQSQAILKIFKLKDRRFQKNRIAGQCLYSPAKGWKDEITQQKQFLTEPPREYHRGLRAERHFSGFGPP